MPSSESNLVRLDPTGLDFGGAEHVATRGPWHFTRQPVISGEQLIRFWNLYSVAFEPLKRQAIARQVLKVGEFAELMGDPRVDKYVAWDRDGRAVGLTTLTRALDAVPWISPDYFAEHYPLYWARNAVYYLGFTLAHPSQRHLRFLETLVSVVMGGLIERKALVAYDLCAFNNDVLRFQERILDAVDLLPTGEVKIADSQYYVCVEFP